MPSGSFTHGMCYTKTYISWARMIQRCYYEKSNRYYLYGAKGITVCDKWKKFEGFYEDMGDRPDGRTLDRINSDGNYEPKNCRWATPHEQQMNRSNTNWFTYRGIRKTLYEWSRELGISYDKMRQRIKRGHSEEEIAFKGNLSAWKRRREKDTT